MDKKNENKTASYLTSRLKLHIRNNRIFTNTWKQNSSLRNENQVKTEIEKEIKCFLKWSEKRIQNALKLMRFNNDSTSSKTSISNDSSSSKQQPPKIKAEEMS